MFFSVAVIFASEVFEKLMHYASLRASLHLPTDYYILCAFLFFKNTFERGTTIEGF